MTKTNVSVKELQENDVISFMYDGGTYPGTVKRICVTQLTSLHTSGYDIDKQEFRNYKNDKISRVMIMDNQPIDEFLRRKDAIRIQRELQSSCGYGVSEIKIIEDILKIIRADGKL